MDAIISAVSSQLISVVARHIEREVRLVVDVRKEVENLKWNLESIQAVLLDAEQRQVKDAAVRYWFDRLKEASYEVEDVLDEWNTAIMKLQIEEGHDDQSASASSWMKKVRSFLPSCFGIKRSGLDPDIARKIRKISENLDAIVKEKDMFHFNTIRSIEKPDRVSSTSYVDFSEVFGREDQKSTLISKLLSKNSEVLDIISVVGMGGTGKTTLAQLAYNDTEVKENFDQRIWVCVPVSFDVVKIAKSIIQAVEGFTPNIVGYESLLEKLYETIKGKKFLLVLDDMWTEDYSEWEPFYHCLKNGLHGSKVLITTRKFSVARMTRSIDIMTMNLLSEKDCWSVFRRLAFSDRSPRECEKLEEIGKKIVSRCNSLPLAIKIMGSHLRFKKTREEWQIVLKNEMWKLEEFGNEIFPPLLLSYNDLPSMVKRCFLYCSIFPKDYKIKKNELIKLWMAQGYLGVQESKEMEVVGQECFDQLAMRSFFESLEKDDDGNVIECQMHDIVHDFAHFLSKDEFLTIEVNDPAMPVGGSFCREKACHSMLIPVDEDASLPLSIFNLKRLRSLLIESNFRSSYSLSNDILKTLFGELMCVRSLKFDVSKCFVEEIPEEVGKLVHLRYLKLSNLSMETLPETLCELYNLQTLDLTWCDKLRELPKGMGKLINLRHLINDHTYSLSCIPIGVERLTGLRTLSRFVVSDGGVDDRRAGGLECLKYLNHLGGSLEIEGLGKVTKVKSVEILSKKKKLSSLVLNFDKNEEEVMGEDDKLVLEALEPPVDLEKLSILRYRGGTFPYWMMSLIRLRKLSFMFCENCHHFPPLGKLPFLESLYISNMKSVKTLHEEFLGIESKDTSLSSSSVILFPKLEDLSFCDMEEWEEWDFMTTWKGEEGIIIMPCLTSLVIQNCPKLKALPDNLLQRTALKLQLLGSSSLESVTKGNLRWLPQDLSLP